MFFAFEDDMRKPSSLAIALLALATLSSLSNSVRAQEHAAPATISPSASTPTKPIGEALPELRDILEKNEQVMGGRAAWSRLTSQRMTGVY
ncbi:MAG: hypothetical protein WCE52_21710, partial [Candidatus Acidiferrum sp.]